jgi:hypothetical protein
MTTIYSLGPDIILYHYDINSSSIIQSAKK